MLLLLGHKLAAVAKTHGGMGRLLDIILHIGAHRTGTTSFQQMLRQAAPALLDDGVVVWEPSKIRDGRFAGLIRPKDMVTKESTRTAQKSRTDIQFELDRLDNTGVKTLIISEENMLGQMYFNLAAHSLYPDARFRLAQFARVFGDRVTRVVMSVRAQESTWRSTLAFGLGAGLDLVAGVDFDDLANAKRRWRHVIEDAQDVFGTAKMVVWQFEPMINSASAQIAAALGIRTPMPILTAGMPQNASPNAQQLRALALKRGLWRMAKSIPNAPVAWQPFTVAQQAGFDTAYRRDLAWLRQQPAQNLEFYDNNRGLCAEAGPDGGRHDNQGRQQMG